MYHTNRHHLQYTYICNEHNSKELHEVEGDQELEIGKWSRDEKNMFFTRHLEFKKKSRFVTCGVTQTQRVRLGQTNKELWVETSNKMEGVPKVCCLDMVTLSTNLCYLLSLLLYMWFLWWRLIALLSIRDGGWRKKTVQQMQRFGR